MQQVADQLEMDITTFSRQVKTPETRGLVSKSPSGADRRANLLILTAAGSQILTQIDSFMETKIENIFASMTPFERSTVIHSLQLLNEAAAKTTCCQTML
jgi:DNA-binding MarR family transcriptional regulator